MLELRLFGRFEALVDGAPLRRLRTHRGQTVLAYLALHAGKAVDRSTLAAIVWPLSDPSDALYSLRRTLTDLRQALGEYSSALVSPSAATLMLDTNRARIDVEEFRKQSDEAADLYRGELLEGWNDDWIVAHRSHFSIKLRECLLGTAKVHEDAGRHRASADSLERLLRHEPHNEDLLRMTIDRLAKAGEPALAWSLYEGFRKRLEEDLGFTVSPETLRKATAIRERANNANQTVEAPVRGFIEPFETSIVGRDTEIEGVEKRLAANHLVTLIGLGGIGKTRLAVEVARLAEGKFTNGAWLIPLASVREPREVALTVSSILRPLDPDPHGAVNRLAERLSNASALVVLDNCEHVIEAVRTLCQHFRAHCPGVRILATSQQAIGLEEERLFRVPVLGIASKEGAVPHSVSLFCERALAANPHLDFDSPTCQAIDRICRRLEGIPLAIELAASRVRYVDPHQLDELLGQRLELLSAPSASRDPRHSTLDATLTWSVDHLKPEEQNALLAAGTFAGSWSVDDLSTVVEAPTLTTVKLLESLVERSLVVEASTGGKPRFRLLEPVRHFAKWRAEESAVAEVLLARHTEMVQRMCEQYSESFSSGKPSQWHAVLEASDDEISEVFHRSVRLGNTYDALRLTASTWRYIWNRGLMQLGRDRAERAISMPNAETFGQPYWDSLHIAGLFAWSQAEFQLAAERVSAALEGYREIGNDEGLGRATANLGQVLRNQGRTFESEALHAKARDIWKRMGHDVRVALSTADLGISAFEQGRLDDSLAFFVEARELSQSLNLESPLAGIDLNEGQTLHELGRFEEAELTFARARKRASDMNVLVFVIMSDHYRAFMQLTNHDYLGAAQAFLSGVEEFIRIGEIRGIMLSIEGLGLAASQIGDVETGGQLIGAAEAMRFAHQIIRTPMDQQRFSRHTAGVQGAAFGSAIETGRQLTRTQVLAIGERLVERLAAQTNG